MTGEQPRCGIFVTVGGREYLADNYPQDGAIALCCRQVDNPDAELFGWDDLLDVWSAVVPLHRCDRVVEVTTVAEFRGHTCQVLRIGADDGADSAVGLYHLGGDTGELAQEGFVQIDAGTWAKTVVLDELARCREHHRDLLFEGWVSTVCAGRAGNPIGKSSTPKSALRRILDAEVPDQRSG